MHLFGLTFVLDCLLLCLFWGQGRASSFAPFLLDCSQSPYFSVGFSRLVRFDGVAAILVCKSERDLGRVSKLPTGAGPASRIPRKNRGTVNSLHFCTTKYGHPAIVCCLWFDRASIRLILTATDIHPPLVEILLSKRYRSVVVTSRLRKYYLAFSRKILSAMAGTRTRKYFDRKCRVFFFFTSFLRSGLFSTQVETTKGLGRVK